MPSHVKGKMGKFIVLKVCNPSSKLCFHNSFCLVRGEMPGQHRVVGISQNLLVGSMAYFAKDNLFLCMLNMILMVFFLVMLCAFVHKKQSCILVLNFLFILLFWGVITHMFYVVMILNSFAAGWINDCIDWRLASALLSGHLSSHGRAIKNLLWFSHEPDFVPVYVISSVSHIILIGFFLVVHMLF